MLSSLALAAAVAVSPGLKPDLNSASAQEIAGLAGLEPAAAESLEVYIFRAGGLEELYQALEAPGITAADLRPLGQAFRIAPPPEGGLSPAVLDVMERLAAEEGPGDAAVDAWENLLVRPLPVNTAKSWDLRSLDRVSLVDAAAVERRLSTIGPVSSVRSLRDVQYLSYYGYRNMEDFISTRELDLSSMELFGSYRVVVEQLSGREDYEEGLGYQLDNLGSALSELESGDRDYSGSPVDSAAVHARLEGSIAELGRARDVTGFSHRVMVGLGDRARGGLRLARQPHTPAGHGLFHDMDLGDVSRRFNEGKAFVSLHNLGPLHQVMLGNYRLSLGQGLMIDNSDELMYRRLDRAWGLHPDLTSTRQFALLGGAAEVRAGDITGYGFFSSAPRDAVVDVDGRPNILIMAPYRTSEMANAVMETTAGAYGFYDLGGWLPTATALGAGYMTVSYSDSLFPDHRYLDIPNDGYAWDCPEYDVMETGSEKSFLALAGQTVLANTSLEGELVRQDNGGMAGLATARWQNDYFYLTGAFRHYGMDFDNPYSRGFAEQKRFDDTVFEKPYYLNDPLASQLEEWPTPKPEEGFYVESRFQVSQHITFTKVYLDVWRSLPYSFGNHRFQGEVEYRPDFPIRFRLKYKYQSKTKMHDVVPTTSRTHETTLRSFFLPSNSDYFSVKLRLGMVELTPNPLYGDDRLLSGGFLSANWEHNFTESFSVLGGSTLWATDGMSQWEFEDTDIDFLDGDGTKLYITIKNTLSDNLQLRFRALRKDTWYPRTGLYRPDPDDQYYYQGDGGAVTDFGDHVTSYGIRCQLDVRW
jgi:hypothetical protein